MTAALSVAQVIENISLGEALFVLRLDGCEALERAEPGQFAMLRGEWGLDPITPRAMSVMRVRGGVAEFLIKVVGRGTAMLRRMRVGERVHVLGPLGHGFPSVDATGTAVFVAGGVGFPPLLMAAERARQMGRASQVTFYYGGRCAADLVLLTDLRAAGVNVVLVTEDGSAGRRGKVTEVLDLARKPTIFACGPNPMLKVLQDIAIAQGLRCWLSIEEKMACAVRACLGCAVPARSKPYLYVCSDGPVFEAGEIWPQ